ncbi:MAG: TlpA family protein disulfide reductase [Hydrogenophaga sp.]|nr:TlpA family protein disulfide reductase [Hydrogenophaga sp.]
MTHHHPPQPLSRRSLVLALSLLGLSAPLLLGGCGRRDMAPNSNFVLLDGSQISTADFKGRVTLVNFWATTCVSCVQKMPYLVSTYNKFKDRGFETVAVAMSYDPPAWVLNFAQTRQLPFKVALDNTGQIAQAWGDVRLTPTTYVVDKQGRIVSQFVGTTDFVALHQLIERLLAQS